MTARMASCMTGLSLFHSATVQARRPPLVKASANPQYMQTDKSPSQGMIGSSGLSEMPVAPSSIVPHSGQARVESLWPRPTLIA
jgi:hypothetical protein